MGTDPKLSYALTNSSLAPWNAHIGIFLKFSMRFSFPDALIGNIAAA